jgi:hypothetical protein
MSRDDRLKLLKELEEKRNAKIIVYVAGDRRELETKIGADVIPIFQNILINLQNTTNTIELVLYSRGGDGTTALTIVSLIREYCNTFNVIIPWRAHSAATLIALGANSIIMLKSGQLSPVDVSVDTAFNPAIETPRGPQFIPINVEDLSGYFSLVKNTLKIQKEENLVKTLGFLTEKINPLAIGAVHRAREKNSKIASMLLEHHMEDEELIKKISEIITMGLYQHSFLISKRDAVNLKLPIENIDEQLEKSIWELFSHYSSLLELNQFYNREKILGSRQEIDVEFHRAIIEFINNSSNLETHTFTTKRRLKRTEITDPTLQIKLPQIIETNLDEGWNINNSV